MEVDASPATLGRGISSTRRNRPPAGRSSRERGPKARMLACGCRYLRVSGTWVLRKAGLSHLRGPRGLSGRSQKVYVEKNFLKIAPAFAHSLPTELRPG